MEKRLENVIIYHSWFQSFENKLSDEQVGKFMKSIGRWKDGDDLYCDDPLVAGMLIPVEKDLNDMLNNYNKKVERNRANGSKGGRPRKTQTEPNETQDNPNNPMGFLETHSNPKNLKDKDRDKDIERDIDIESKIATGEKIIVDFTWTPFEMRKYLEDGFTLFDKSGLEITQSHIDDLEMSSIFS